MEEKGVEVLMGWILNRNFQVEHWDSKTENFRKEDRAKDSKEAANDVEEDQI